MIFYYAGEWVALNMNPERINNIIYQSFPFFYMLKIVHALGKFQWEQKQFSVAPAFCHAERLMKTMCRYYLVTTWLTAIFNLAVGVQRYNLTCNSLLPSSCKESSGCSGNYTFIENCSMVASTYIGSGVLSIVGINGGRHAIDGGWDLVQKSSVGLPTFACGTPQDGTLNLQNIIIAHGKPGLNLGTCNLILTHCVLDANMNYLGGVSRKPIIVYLVVSNGF